MFDVIFGWFGMWLIYGKLNKVTLFKYKIHFYITDY